MQHLPDFININGTCVKCSLSFRNLVATLDSTLSLHQRVINISYFERRHINSIQNILSIVDVKILVCSLVLSRIDYCNSLFVGLPQYLRGFNEFKMKQPDRYLEHLDLRSSHHSSRTFGGGLSIGEGCTRLLHYVILHYLALALNTCLTILMFTPLLDPCTRCQISIS